MAEPAVAESFAAWAAALRADDVPAAVARTLRRVLVDHAGLCVAARGTDYVAAVRAAADAPGPCTAIGHAGGCDAGAAALVNGTAAHGEDYDDTFEGTPVHTGAVVVPAVLAAAERFGLSGADVLRGLAAGTELMCRMALVAPMAIHRAGFHPTAVIGALGAAAGVGTALGQPAKQITDALGIAGSLASGIIEYLAEGSSTKRLHAGRAAESGLRAALLAGAGFSGPRTVIEGRHGFFFAFADHAVAPDYGRITEALGTRWHAAEVAFKPYACGTMAQPFIDCAIALRSDGIEPADIAAMTCKVGEGTVHRLWEPLAEKHRPSTPYSAKFSVPYCIAVALADGAAGLGQFTEARVSDPAVLDLARRVAYEIDPADEYPANYTGHIRATLADGSVREARQPHLRGGARAPLSDDEIAAKFAANIAFGGWTTERGERLRVVCEGLFEAPDISGLSAFRG